ncbi:YdeI/OmpD-associated family protein [Spirosoma rhododendri]|uniref:Bacteriocin-protection protein n=1 Tax=Spirosoma rhododendri TaxID=2728024 RepID=A0A7L5DGE5_9BACT|nr:YdeI/OmpD-associated family protein [Spirosoma rhododendri]QJD76975.1 hypothetical protein HH216_00015 [Spirosoma rhododendri]
MQQEINTFFPENRQQWREWLAEHHAAQASVWLLYPKKKSGRIGVTYNEAVEEALCFGWIDSTAKPVDADTFMQFFCPRKPKSGWSKVNKERLVRLVDVGLMMPAGMASIERAKENGSWLLLDEAEAQVIPADLATELAERPTANEFFTSLCRSDKRTLLIWISAARRSETRQKRIAELVDCAEQRLKPKLLPRPKKEV